MRRGDRILQAWRVARARRFIPPGARLLDIGCADGVLFERLRDRVSEGIGVDPTLKGLVDRGSYKLLPGRFPEVLHDSPPFDAITMLALLEHIPRSEQAALAASCAAVLKPGGHLIITVPSPMVDHILALLKKLRVVDGMSTDEHHGYEPALTPRLFDKRWFTLVEASRFQCGLNHLFVFTRNSRAV